MRNIGYEGETEDEKRGRMSWTHNITGGSVHFSFSLEGVEQMVFVEY